MPKKYCRKFEPPESGARTLQTTDRQTTDGRATANSEFAKIKAIVVDIRLCPRCCPLVSHFEYITPYWRGVCLADYGQTRCPQKRSITYCTVDREFGAS